MDPKGLKELLERVRAEMGHAAGDLVITLLFGGKGQKLQLKITSNASGFPLDPVLSLYDAEGKLLKEVDDVSRQLDPELQWTAPADGLVHAEIRDMHDRGRRC